jgi:hypothetical protein
MLLILQVASQTPLPECISITNDRSAYFDKKVIITQDVHLIFPPSVTFSISCLTISSCNVTVSGLNLTGRLSIQKSSISAVNSSFTDHNVANSAN